MEHLFSLSVCHVMCFSCVRRVNKKNKKKGISAVDLLFFILNFLNVFFFLSGPTSAGLSQVTDNHPTIPLDAHTHTHVLNTWYNMRRATVKSENDTQPAGGGGVVSVASVFYGHQRNPTRGWHMSLVFYFFLSFLSSCCLLENAYFFNIFLKILDSFMTIPIQSRGVNIAMMLLQTFY